MARVVLPLLGVEARGKIGNALVYMPIPHATHGLTSVRVWTVPKNPKTGAQGDVRLKMKAVGHGISAMYRLPITSPTVFAPIITAIKAVTPATQIWNAFFVKTLCGDAFATLNASRTAYASPAFTITWESSASSLGILDQDVTYATIDPITAGEILFLHARAAYDLDLAIATVDAQSMSTIQIEAFADDYQSPT